MSAARFGLEVLLAWLVPWRAVRRIRSQEQSILWLIDRIVMQRRQQQEAARPRLYLVR